MKILQNKFAWSSPLRNERLIGGLVVSGACWQVGSAAKNPVTLRTMAYIASLYLTAEIASRDGNFREERSKEGSILKLSG